MNSKLTLARYLRGGGEVKTLTRIEALVFGIPYPLQADWPGKYGAMAITDEMIENVKARVALVKESTARTVHRWLDGVGEAEPAARPAQHSLLPPADALHASRTSPVPGFVLRQAKRYSLRKLA